MWYRLLLLGVLSGVLLGCQHSDRYENLVEVDSAGPLDVKTELARRIVQLVVDSRLEQRMRERVPNVRADLLAQLSVGVKVIRTPGGGERVYVACNLRSQGPPEGPRALIHACGSELVLAANRVLGPPTR